MKPITEETKIKDLIPDGYEFKHAESADAFAEEEGVVTFVTIHRNKKQKTFEDYVGGYTSVLPDRIGTSIMSCIESDGRTCLKNILNKEYFYKVPFEFKIGLLKFICDDMKVNWNNYLEYKKDQYMGMEGLIGVEFIEIESVVPNEFVQSIFK